MTSGAFEWQTRVSGGAGLVPMQRPGLGTDPSSGERSGQLYPFGQLIAALVDAGSLVSMDEAPQVKDRSVTPSRAPRTSGGAVPETVVLSASCPIPTVPEPAVAGPAPASPARPAPGAYATASFFEEPDRPQTTVDADAPSVSPSPAISASPLSAAGLSSQLLASSVQTGPEQGRQQVANVPLLEVTSDSEVASDSPTGPPAGTSATDLVRSLGTKSMVDRDTSGAGLAKPARGVVDPASVASQGTQDTPAASGPTPEPGEGALELQGPWRLALQDENDPSSNSGHGTPHALQITAMKNAVHASKDAELNQQNLPDQPESGPVPGPAGPSPAAPAAAPQPSPASLQLLFQALERTHDIVALHALRIRDAGTDHLHVVIKPGAGVQLSMELRQHEGRVQVQVWMHRGDFDFFQRHWKELQERFESRGLELGDLQRHPSFQSGSQRSAYRPPEGEWADPLMAGAFAEFALAGSLTEPPGRRAFRTAQQRGWESWA